MSSSKSAPWSLIHLNILLYLAWQYNGRYKEIEEAWNKMAPDSKRSLRAITDRLQSIQKDIRSVGLQRYFETGPPSRRRSEKPSEGRVIIRPNTCNAHTAKPALALPRHKAALTDLTESNYESNVDDEATPWNTYDANPHYGTNDEVQELKAFKQDGSVLRSSSKRKHVGLLPDLDEVERIDILPSPPKRQRR